MQSVQDSSQPKNKDTYHPRLSLSSLISPPLPKFRLLPISLAHRRIKGNDKNKRLSGKKMTSQNGSQPSTGLGSTPSNSSSADSTPQKNKQPVKPVLRYTNRPNLGFNGNRCAESIIQDNGNDGEKTSSFGGKISPNEKIDSIQVHNGMKRQSPPPLQIHISNTRNTTNSIISPNMSSTLSKEQLLKPPAPPRPKRAIVMKQLLLEKRTKDRKNSLFSSTAEDENDSDEEESCSFVSSLESMKSLADSGGSTSDGIQSLISSTESGVVALGRSSTGTGCLGSMSSNNSSTTDINIPQLSKDKTPKKSHFRIEQRASGSFSPNSSIVNRHYVASRHYVAKNVDLRQHHNSMIRPLLASSKFPVLSPISDKSQEQCPSEVGEGNGNTTGSTSSYNRTPKVSPTDQILAACCVGGSRVEETDGVDDVTFVSFKQHSSNIDLGPNSNLSGAKNSDEQDCSLYVSESTNTQNNNILSQNSACNDAEAQLQPAPFSMPKLERRLQQERERRTESHKILTRNNRSIAVSNMYNNNNKGSDSGISMAGSSSHGGCSGDSSNEQGNTSAQDMFQLLQGKKKLK